MFGKFSRRKNSESNPATPEDVHESNGPAENAQPDASARVEGSSCNLQLAGGQPASEHRVTPLNLSNKSVDELFELLGRQVGAS